MFLDNWTNSPCWDVQLPEPQADSEAFASGVPRLRPAPSDERLTGKPEPLELGAGALLAHLGISIRYVNTPEEAEQVVESLAGQTGRFGIDVETAKLTPYAHHGQAGLNPHLSRIRLLQLYAGVCWWSEVIVFDLRSTAGSLATALGEAVCRSQRHIRPSTYDARQTGTNTNRLHDVAGERSHWKAPIAGCARRDRTRLNSAGRSQRHSMYQIGAHPVCLPSSLNMPHSTR